MDATSTQRSTFSAEEAWRLHPPGLWELIEGRLVHMSPAGARHGHVVARVTRLLAAFVDAQRLGTVMAGDVGFVLRRNPDTVRAPDIAFLTKARLPGRPPAEFMDGAPDLAIEILSPSDHWSAVDEKAREFLSAGALAVWAIDPAAESAKVYSRDTTQVIARGEALTCPALLGALEIRLADLWS